MKIGDERLSEIRLEFDGLKLKAVDKMSGSVVKSWDAISGRPGNQAPSQSHIVNTGPIPQGNWSISTGKIVDFKDLPKWRQLLSGPYISSPRGGTAAWGNSFVRIEPLEGTNTFDRSGFHIHGGDEAGSAGCIDLVGGNDDFFNFLKKYQGDIDLTVDYSANEKSLNRREHPMLRQHKARDGQGLSFDEVIKTMEKLYQGDINAIEWFGDRLSSNSTKQADDFHANIAFSNNQHRTHAKGFQNTLKKRTAMSLAGARQSGEIDRQKIKSHIQRARPTPFPRAKAIDFEAPPSGIMNGFAPMGFSEPRPHSKLLQALLNSKSRVFASGSH